MKERVIFYQYGDFTKLFEVIMPNASEWDWPLLFSKITPEQIKQLKETFLLFINEGTPEEDKVVMEDIIWDEDFENYLCDYDGENFGFWSFELIEDTPCSHIEGMTIRLLYELAKKKNALDIPIIWNYEECADWCEADYEPFTEENILITEQNVEFLLS